MTQLVVPMSGLGERFQRAGYDLPKPLIRVEDTSMVSHVVDMFPSIQSPVFIVNREHLETISYRLEATLRALRPECHIVSIDPHKRGPGWALLSAIELLDPNEPVVVSYCDFAALFDEKSFLSTVAEADGVIGTYTGFHPHMFRSTKFAYVQKRPDGRVINIQEKGSFTSSPLDEEASCGLYAFGSGKILHEALEDQIRHNESLNGEYYTSLTYLSLLRRELDIRTYLVDAFMQWGTPEDLEDYQQWSRAFRSLCGAAQAESREAITITLAAGAGSRFVDAGYPITKPRLDVFGESGWRAAARSLGTRGRECVVLRSDQPEFDSFLDQARSLNVQVGLASSLTRGQAESALIGLREMKDESGPVVITACDGVFVAQPDLSGITSDPAVFLVENYRPALINPTAFSWARIDNQGRISEILLKTRPPDGTWAVLTGTFSFPTVQEGIEMLDDFMSSDNTVNGELYLDTLFSEIVLSGKLVRASLTSDFLSFGTPLEYESLRYWQKTFTRWLGHPYKITTDRMIQQNRRGLVANSLSVPARPFWHSAMA